MSEDLKNISKRFAEINDISEAKAAELLEGAENAEEALERIKQFNLAKIREQNPMPSMNRKQRRALKKKMGSEIDLITDAAEKLNYIDLIQKFRELNKKREKEEKKENEDTTKDY